MTSDHHVPGRWIGFVVHILQLADVPPQRWRNGGGSTQELLAWPAAADWVVRISVARIDADGPFSAFPGIDRWFAVVHGEGVALQFPTGDHVLREGTPPMRFDGALAPGCTLLSGATQDLNLMVHRDGGRGVMLDVVDGDPWRADAMLRAVYTSTTASLQVGEGQRTELPAGTLAWSADAASEVWRLSAAPGAVPLRAWWLACAGVTSPA